MKYTIVHVTNYYFPSVGGITTQISYLKEIFEKKGIRSYVIAFPYVFRIIESWIKISFLRKFIHNIFVFFFVIISSLRVFFIRLFNKRVIVHSHDAYFCALVGVISRYYGCKSVHILRTDLNYRGSSSSKLLQKMIFSRCDVLSFVSEFMKKQYIEKFGIDKANNKANNKQKLLVAYGGIDVAKYMPKSTDELIFDYVELRRPIIMFVGYLFFEKRPRVLLKACAMLKNKDPKKYANLSIIMIGDGELRKKLANLAKSLGLSKNLYLLGNIPKDKVIEYYNLCDVVVHPSAMEAFGNAVLEAMSCGKPIIASNTGGIPEIIDHDVNGILVDVDDYKSIAKYLDRILSDKKLYDSLAKNARKKIKRSFSWSKTAKRFEKMYEEVLR